MGILCLNRFGCSLKADSRILVRSYLLVFYWLLRISRPLVGHEQTPFSTMGSGVSGGKAAGRDKKQVIIWLIRHCSNSPSTFLKNYAKTRPNTFLTRLSRFSQAKFFRKIAICSNINQLENFVCFDEKHNLLIMNYPAASGRGIKQKVVFFEAPQGAGY